MTGEAAINIPVGPAASAFFALRIAGYREALRICEVSAEQGGITTQGLKNEFAEMEKAYHYAQRYIHLYTRAEPGTTPTAGQKAKELASHKLAFQAVFELVDSGVDGIAYSSRRMRYVVLPSNFPWAEGDFRKTYDIGMEYVWCENPWFAVAAAEKMTSGIRRVKAKTVAEVKARLFMPLEARHAV